MYVAASGTELVLNVQQLWCEDVEGDRRQVSFTAGGAGESSSSIGRSFGLNWVPALPSRCVVVKTGG